MCVDSESVCRVHVCVGKWRREKTEGKVKKRINKKEMGEWDTETETETDRDRDREIYCMFVASRTVLIQSPGSEMGSNRTVYAQLDGCAFARVFTITSSLSWRA